MKFTYPINTSITHLIDRHPDSTNFGDACLGSCGDLSHHPQFWLHFDFPQEIKNLTLKQDIVLTRDKLTDQLVSINILEFVTEIVNYSAILVAFSTTPTIFSTEFSVLLNWTDNNTTKSWTRKSATKSDKDCALQRVLCGFMINSKLGLQSQWIAGVNNIIAGKISRIYSTDTK